MSRIDTFRSLVKAFSGRNISVYAANASFFILLAVFPALMLMICLLQYTVLTPEDFLDAMRGVLPQVLRPLLSYIVTDLYGSNSVALISLSAVTAVWSASRGVYSLFLGLNAIYGVRESRNYFIQRLICIFYTLLLFAALLATLVLHLFGQRIDTFLAQQSIPIFRLLLFLIRLRWLIVTLLLTGLFVMILLVFPNRKLPFRSVLPGALGSAVGWVVFSSLFSYYVNHFGSYSKVYGSLATVALAMLWLYFCMSILFYGALLNHLLDRRAALRRSKPGT